MEAVTLTLTREEWDNVRVAVRNAANECGTVGATMAGRGGEWAKNAAWAFRRSEELHTLADKCDDAADDE